MTKIIKIKKGLDIPIEGEVTNFSVKPSDITKFAISPMDFPGITWKSLVKQGDLVEIGSPLMYDKECRHLALTSPVAGKVTEVVRGERRRIIYIIVEKIGDQNPGDAKQRLQNHINSNKEITYRELIQASGLWAFMRQRPFDIVPLPDSVPRDIYITDFDSAPLGGPLCTEIQEKYISKGIEILKTLTTGKIFYSTRDASKINFADVEVIEMQGPHPAGNVGVQIAATKPVNKGECVWTLTASTAARIGKLFADDSFDFTTLVTIAGSEVKNPEIVETEIGCSLSELLYDNLKQTDHIRIISGNVLSGVKVNLSDDFLRFPYRQITAIPEGDNADEFMGWASVNPNKYSVKHSFPAFLTGLGKKFNFDARIKGGHRAPILSGELDKVFPFDIYPEFLLRAIEANDIDRMEQLGIYEVAPEDFALPEFVDTSKQPLQKMVRDALDNLQKEL